MKRRVTAVVLAISHTEELTWDDVIAHALKCKARGMQMQIRRRKKTRKMRARGRELRELIAAQRADQNDRHVRFEHAIGSHS